MLLLPENTLSDSQEMAGDRGKSEWQSGPTCSVWAIKLWTLALKNILTINPVNVTALFAANLVNLRTRYGSRFACIPHDNLTFAVHVANFSCSFCGFHGERSLTLRGAA